MSLNPEQAIVGARVKIPTQKSVGCPLETGGGSLVDYARHYNAQIIITQVVPWEVEGKQCVVLGLNNSTWHNGNYFAFEDLTLYS